MQKTLTPNAVHKVCSFKMFAIKICFRKFTKLIFDLFSMFLLYNIFRETKETMSNVDEYTYTHTQHLFNAL